MPALPGASVAATVGVAAGADAAALEGDVWREAAHAMPAVSTSMIAITERISTRFAVFAFRRAGGVSERVLVSGADGSRLVPAGCDLGDATVGRWAR